MNLQLDIFESALEKKWSQPFLETFSGRLCTDTRKLQKGDIFLAIRGETFDGHTFLAQAKSAGAAGCLVQEDHAYLPDDFPRIQVSNTIDALQAIAHAHRKTLPTTIIGITGSNGKTTVKELTAKLIQAMGKNCYYTEANLNNQIGCPQALLEVNEEHEFAVIEAGMGDHQDIQKLGKMLEPNFGIVTNIGTAHIEYLGSIENIANEKSQMVRHLARGGIGFVSQPYLDQKYFTEGNPHPIKFIEAEPLPFKKVGQETAAGLELAYKGSTFHFPLLGNHNVQNLHLVVRLLETLFKDDLDQVAHALETLQNFELPGMRFQKYIGDVNVILDCYNANPQSFVAGFQAYSQLPISTRRVAVIGDMAEINDTDGQLHFQTGYLAWEQGKIDHLIATGQFAETMAAGYQKAGGKDVWVSHNPIEITEYLREVLQPNEWVYLKASRSQRLEEIIEPLLEEWKCFIK